MNPVIMVATATCLGMVLALMLLFRKLSSSGSSLPLTADWIEELSIDCYRPMLRLLDGEDLTAELRMERCQLFRDHLRHLTEDFGRVCTALKLVMLQSGGDRPDLASILIHQQIMYTCGLLVVYSRLFLYRWGICTVDVTSLLKIFDGMRLELQSMVSMAEPMSA